MDKIPFSLVLAERLKNRTFAELAQIIRTCLSHSEDLEKIDHTLLTTDKNILSQYLQELENKIPPYPPLPKKPKRQFNRKKLTSKEKKGYKFVNIVLEEKKYRRAFLLEYEEYQRKIAKVAPIIDRIRTQERILENLRKEFEKFVVIGAKKLNWKFLPPGSKNYQLITEHYLSLSRNDEEKRFDYKRLEQLYSYFYSENCEIYIGEDEFEGYIAFHFPHIPLTVLECPIIGNAIYVFHTNWKFYSRQKKSDLINTHSGKIIRVIHKGDWFSHLKNLFRIEKENSKKGKDKQSIYN